MLAGFFNSPQVSMWKTGHWHFFVVPKEPELPENDESNNWTDTYSLSIST